LGCFVKKVTTEYIVNADVLAILLEKEAIMEVIEPVKSSKQAPRRWPQSVRRSKIFGSWKMP